jgi:hypothetical protein
MWIVSFVFLSYCDTIHVEFIFLLYLCILNFVAKNVGIINTYVVNTNIEFFKNLQIGILRSCIMWYSPGSCDIFHERMRMFAIYCY